MRFPSVILAAVISLAATVTLRAEDFAGADTCANCHAQEYADWKPSIHAKALSDKFKRIWKELGSKPECLRCHVTGHKAGTHQYAAAGVSCESCHGAMNPNHPAEAKMPIPVSSEMCKTCHPKTFKEWAVSKHAHKNIRCFDCHKAHGQGLRAGGGDTLCGSCHPGRMKDFAHATHHQEGLKCETCHMPASKTDADAIQGTGAAAHSMSVGVEVCARCHEESVHKSGRLSALREEVSAFQHQTALAGGKGIFELKEDVKKLDWQLKRARASTWLAALLGVIAGCLLGWLACWYLSHRKPPHG